MALHEQSVGASNEWFTPAHVFEAMNVRFDLDPAHPGGDLANWVPATRVITAANCGLRSPWTRDGLPRPFVWLNPPFGARNGLVPWLEKFFAHGDGVMLTPDRTSAPWWQDYAPKADAILFVRRKLRFVRPDGTEGASPAQGTTLLAAGPRGVQALRNAAKAGLGFTVIP